MRARLTKVIAGVTAVAALAFGGAALAGAANSPAPAAPPAASASSATESGTESEATAESSSEVAGPSDGPGGHADEPGNANADYQFQGEQ